MKVVGVTGGIGSGKSTVCRIFGLLGVPVFYADEEAKKLYDESGIRSKVVKLFGKKALDENRRIDKHALAQMIFSDKTLLSKLNAIIHPSVRSKFVTWKKRQKGNKIVIKEAAIMIESGAYKDVDYLISVNSNKELRINRIIKRSNMTFSEIGRRMSEQISDKEREKYSDAVIINDEEHSLIKQVLKLHRKLTRI